jgi:hypothetical protein
MGGVMVLIFDEIATNPPSVVCLLAERLMRPDLLSIRIHFISSNQ